MGLSIYTRIPSGGGGVSGGTVDLHVPYVFTFPGDANTLQNDQIPRLSKKAAHEITEMELIVQGAPTGQALIVNFRRGNLSTGALTGIIGTVTLPAGSFNAVFTPGAPVAIAATEFVTASIDQVGSVNPGHTLTMIARVDA